MKRCLITLIKFYQIYLSPLKPRTCRFYPTCSQYMLEAVEKYGINKGISMGLRRILRCNPLNKGGYDPV